MYKREIQSREKSPKPLEEVSYLEAILNNQAPVGISRGTQPLSRKDELFVYLAEPPTNLLGALDY